MRTVIALIKRELISAVVTPLFYMLAAGFTLLCGCIFFGFVRHFNLVVQQAAVLKEALPNLNEVVVAPYYNSVSVVLIFLIPTLTMRSFAEERAQGTHALLFSSSLSFSQIVLGKFLAFAIFIAILLCLSFLFPLSLVLFSTPEIGSLFVTLGGIFLYTLACGAVGMAVSSRCSTQIVAGVVTLIVLLLLYMIDVPAAEFTSGLGAFVHYLAPTTHLRSFLRGIISSSAVVYFVSLIAVGTYAACQILETERWR